MHVSIRTPDPVVAHLCELVGEYLSSIMNIPIDDDFSDESVRLSEISEIVASLRKAFPRNSAVIVAEIKITAEAFRRTGALREAPQ